MDEPERLLGAYFDFGYQIEWCDWLGAQAQAIRAGECWQWAGATGVQALIADGL